MKFGRCLDKQILLPLEYDLYPKKVAVNKHYIMYLFLRINIYN